MAYRDLQHFVEILEKRGELVRIKEELSTELEITEVTDRVSKRAGPALLFEKPKGFDIPVLMNALGSFRRMNLALEVEDLREIGEEILSFIEMEMPRGLIKKLRILPKLKRLADISPIIVREGPCQEVVIKDDIRLDIFPVLKCWPMDGGRFITLPLVITKHPETGIRNIGMYRMQIFDRQTTGMHWHIHKGGAEHYRIAERLNRRLEVAVAIGPDPAVTYAATAPLPQDIDEMVLAGFLRRQPVEMVKCLTIQQEVPANSQIVLEGYVNPGERRREGPFGDHTGYYSLEEDYPVFHVTCITHRKKLIYPATIVGKPPMEDCFMAKATERIFIPFLKKQLPELVDINLPVEGVFHNMAFVSIDKSYPGQAKKVMHALWGMGQMMFVKIIIVFDKDVNVQDNSEVLWRLGNNIDPQRDTVFTEGPVDALDCASRLPKLGTKMGIDVTRKWPEEGFHREWPPEINMNLDVKARIDQIWSQLGV